MNEWIDQYKKYHAELNTNYPGNNLKPQLHHIKDLVIDTKSETLLDYGCGKGLQYSKWKHHKDLGVMPSLYDPAVPEYENLPDGPFHGVFSTDVLEHIPEIQIPEVIEKMTFRAERFVFAAICNSPAIAVLPNGENAHCTCKPIEWWKEMFMKHSYKQVYTHIKTYGSTGGYEILNEALYLEFYWQQLEDNVKKSLKAADK